MKLNLIYYKNILDIIVSRFIDDYNDSFVKINDCYVLSIAIDRDKLKKFIVIALKNFIDELNVIIGSSYDKILIIGACYPVNNVLVSLQVDKSSFPQKLQQYLQQKPEIKYVLKERDVLIDIDMFNSVAIEVFNEMMSNEKQINKTFGANSKNIVFVTHKSLDCYMVFKAIKWLYGQSNCVNVWKNKLNAPCNNIIALNDVISRYAPNKRALNSSKQFKMYVNELHTYLSNKLGF